MPPPAPPLSITVQYSCPDCELIAVSVEVPVREPHMDVRDWMTRTISLVAADHERRSPRCHPQRLYDLMIPMTGRASIGGPVIQ